MEPLVPLRHRLDRGGYLGGASLPACRPVRLDDAPRTAGVVVRRAALRDALEPEWRN